MTKKKKIRLLVFFIVLMALVGMGIILTNGLVSKSETIQEVMKDAVLHDTGKVSLFGIKDVNPALISAFTITVVILIVALVIRIVVVPKFKIVPGKFQLLLEQWVGYFNKLAISNSPDHHKFLSVYLFVAGSYVFISTLFELFGLQAINTHGASITLPAPLADINAAIATGVMSYLVILGGGIAANGLKGAGQTLKDFSLPISMSFRLFGDPTKWITCKRISILFNQFKFCITSNSSSIIYIITCSNTNLCLNNVSCLILWRSK